MIIDDIANLFYELEKEHTHKEIARQFGRERKFVIAMKNGCPFRLNAEMVAGLGAYGYELRLVRKAEDEDDTTGSY